MTSVDTVEHDDWLEQIRLRLQQARQTHSTQLHTLAATTPDPGEASAHAALVARTQQAFNDATAALDSIDDKTYGRCEVCGGPIPKERLEAIPHARTCVSCPRGV